jgi:hypothetical protein
MHFRGEKEPSVHGFVILTNLTQAALLFRGRNLTEGKWALQNSTPSLVTPNWGRNQIQDQNSTMHMHSCLNTKYLIVYGKMALITFLFITS